MKKNTQMALLHMTLGLSLGVVCALAGQSAYAQHFESRSRPLTPEEQALSIRIGLLDSAAAEALDAGQYNVAENEARQVLALGQDSGIAQEVLAAALNAEGKQQEALQAYQVLATEGTDKPRNLLPYALLLLKTGQYASAVAAYNKALPLVAEGDVLEAKGSFSGDTSQSADFLVALHVALGLTAYGACDWTGRVHPDKAMQELTTALQLAPASDIANYYYGFVLQQSGQTAQAQVAFAKAVKIGRGAVKVAAAKALKKARKPA